MEKRIELEKRGMSPDKIKDLILDNCRSTSIVGLTDEFVNLESLSLINVGLTSLKGFPNLPKLKRLELSDNRISSCLNLLHTSPQLTSLNMSNNRIKEFDVLKPLAELKHLQNLDLFNNDVTNLDNYRETTFNLIPGLKYLDGFDKDNKEADESEDDEVNGNLEEESEDVDEEEDSDDDDDEEEVGLDTVYKDNLEEESECDDYEGEEEEDEDDDDLDEDDDEAEEDSTPRGKKRKLEDGGKEDSGSKKSSNGPTV